jgi:hypothetical protein
VELGHQCSCFESRATLSPDTRNIVGGVREIVERAEVAARPGAVWRIVLDVPDVDVTRAREPRELAWTSVVSLGDGDDGVEAQSWFRLAPNWTGTEVEYGVWFPRELGAAEVADVRRRIVAQLASVKARAESTL